jgi:DNA-directed RNA polymerase specialized sigma24 family protein
VVAVKAYFAVCVTNKIRDRVRARRRQATASLEEPESLASGEVLPDLAAIRDEELCRLARALNQL